MNLGQVRILVVGAGVAGLALRRALQRRGCLADIIERNVGWSDAGTGMYLPGNAMRALGALELNAEVAQQGARIDMQRFCDHRGRFLGAIDLGSVWNETGPCLAIHRADLHRALRDAQDTSPIRMGVTLVSLDQAAESAMVELSDGTREEYDLVVGADGIGSSVRRLLFDDAGLRALKQWGWRFVIPCPSHVRDWSVSMSRKSACLTVPIGRGMAYCYIDLMGAERPDLTATPFADPAASPAAAPAPHRPPPPSPPPASENVPARVNEETGERFFAPRQSRRFRKSFAAGGSQAV